MPDERRVAEDLPSFLADPDGLALPEPLDVADAAQKVLALHEAGGRKGATFSLRFGDMRGQALYAVSVWPERGRTPSGDTVRARILQSFIEENLDLLADPYDPRCGVGLWYSADDGVTYLDIVAILSSKQEAIALALKYDQIAIFELGSLIEISTDGTGNTPEGMPPATERLPKMSPEEKGQI